MLQLWWNLRLPAVPCPLLAVPQEARIPELNSSSYTGNLVLVPLAAVATAAAQVRGEVSRFGGREGCWKRDLRRWKICS